MTGLSDHASIDLADRRLDTWESYEITSDLLTPADAWSMSVPFRGTVVERREMKAAIEGAPTVQLYIGRDVTGRHDERSLQMTGIVDDYAIDGDREGGVRLRISGRDVGGLLAGSSADVTLGVSEETEFVSFVRQMCQPFGIEVVTEGAPARSILTGAIQAEPLDAATLAQARAAGISPAAARRAMHRRLALEGGRPLDEELGGTSSRAGARARRGSGSGQTGSDVERLRITEAKPHAGETIWDFIDRHARRFGVLPWMDPRGRLILSAPDYGQRPLGRLQRWLDPTVSAERNNIVSGGLRRNIGSQPSTVTVYGRAHGHDATRSPFHSTITNADIAIHRPLVIHDPAVRSQEEAERRAQRELARLVQEATVLDYEVRDHGLGRYLYAIDTVLEVSDEVADIEGSYYVVSRTFSKTRDRGTTTRLRLVPLFAIAL